MKNRICNDQLSCWPSLCGDALAPDAEPPRASHIALADAGAMAAPADIEALRRQGERHMRWRLNVPRLLAYGLTDLQRASATAPAPAPAGGESPLVPIDPTHIELRKAVLSGDERRVSALLSQAPFRIDERDSHGRTALHLAAQLGHLCVLTVLIDGFEGVQPDVNARTRFGLTPLHYAAARGDTGSILVLLAAGAECDTRTAFGATPRDIAQCNGNGYASGLLAGLWRRERAARWNLSAKDRVQLMRLNAGISEKRLAALLGVPPAQLRGMLAN